MADKLDIENPKTLVDYLRRHAHITPDETPRCTVLPGGVSNRTVLVERASGDAWVLKQALPKLRVKEDWFSDPTRTHREALGLQWLARFAPVGSITPLVFEDRAHHLLAMQAVPRPHENWKRRLLSGRVERELVEQFGRLLGTIHRRAYELQSEVGPVFDDRTFFETLRVEPYYRFTASRVPQGAHFLERLIVDTLATRLTLVHGDYSPKNILVHGDQLVLLDHEVIHWGDPAFDLGFSLTHFLSKANHLPAQRALFLEAARWHWESYRKSASALAETAGLEARAVRHTLGCMLARVDGRSPLEYLTEAERDRQRAIIFALMLEAPGNLPEVFQAFGAKLNG